jgi:hypothetical protein
VTDSLDPLKKVELMRWVYQGYRPSHSPLPLRALLVRAWTPLAADPFGLVNTRAILADALEEAGFTDQVTLAQLRGRMA